MQIRLKIVFVSAKVLATVYVNEGFIAIEVVDVPLDFVRVLRKSIWFLAKMTISTNKNLDPPSISLPAFSELFMYHARIKLPKIHGSNMSLNYGLQWWASRYGMNFKCE